MGAHAGDEGRGRLYQHLEAIELGSFPKTTGKSGMLVLVPLGEGQCFETARAPAKLLGKLLVDEHPVIATMDRVVSRRGARVCVDTRRAALHARRRSGHRRAR